MGEYLDGQTIIELIKGCSSRLGQVCAFAGWCGGGGEGGGFLLELVDRDRCVCI